MDNYLPATGQPEIINSNIEITNQTGGDTTFTFNKVN